MARGTAKTIYDMRGFGGLRIERIIEFDDREEFPTVGERFIGPLPDPADPLSALHGTSASRTSSDVRSTTW